PVPCAPGAFLCASLAFTPNRLQPQKAQINAKSSAPTFAIIRTFCGSASPPCSHGRVVRVLRRLLTDHAARTRPTRPGLPTTPAQAAGVAGRLVFRLKPQ